MPCNTCNTVPYTIPNFIQVLQITQQLWNKIHTTKKLDTSRRDHFCTKWKSMSYSDIVRPFIFNMNGDYAEPQTKSIETKASVTNTKIFLFRSSWTFEHRPDRSHLNESTLIHKYTDISTFDSSFHMYDIGLILEVCPSNDLCPSNHLTR